MNAKTPAEYRTPLVKANTHNVAPFRDYVAADQRLFLRLTLINTDKANPAGKPQPVARFAPRHVSGFKHPHPEF